MLPLDLAALNNQQRAAVQHPGGPAIVLAGPGSGKTRVLTHRIAYLARSGVDPTFILALTFTKKAAGEMKKRLAAMGVSVRAQTMHGWCMQLLRTVGVDGWTGKILKDYAQRIAWQQAIRACRKVRGAGEAPDKVSAAKNRGISLAGAILAGVDEATVQVWGEYERIKRQQGKLDYDDLLLEAYKVLRDDPSYARARWPYLLVDEVQDLNLVQWKIIRQLADPASTPNLFVVGDVDQAIYTWRGAEPGMAMRFTAAWPGARLYVLDRNYRSVPQILSHAQDLIAHNEERFDKSLVPFRSMRAPGAVRYVHAESEQEEAEAVADSIRGWMSRLARPRDIAIMVRCWWVTAALEDVLTERNIPYRVLGGYGFFDRKEIQAMLGYLRLAQNPDDDDALTEVFNVPNRYLGQKQRSSLQAVAAKYGQSLFDALPHAALGWSGHGGYDLWRKVASLRVLAERNVRPGLILQEVYDSMRFEPYLAAMQDGEDRIDNVREMIARADQHATVAAYLGHVERVQRFARDNEEHPDSVSILTIHRAKGMEWPCAVLAGAGEGVLPHERNANVEEERRLAFVAMTRAEDRLLVTSSAVYRGRTTSPSRFVVEAGLACAEHASPLPCLVCEHGAAAAG